MGRVILQVWIVAAVAGRALQDSELISGEAIGAQDQARWKQVEHESAIIKKSITVT